MFVYQPLFQFLLFFAVFSLPLRTFSFLLENRKVIRTLIQKGLGDSAFLFLALLSSSIFNFPCNVDFTRSVLIFILYLFWRRKMDRYQRVEKPKAETPIDENEIRITSQGRMRSYITYAMTLLQVFFFYKAYFIYLSHFTLKLSP